MRQPQAVLNAPQRVVLRALRVSRIVAASNRTAAAFSLVACNGLVHADSQRSPVPRAWKELLPTGGSQWVVWTAASLPWI